MDHFTLSGDETGWLRNKTGATAPRTAHCPTVDDADVMAGGLVDDGIFAGGHLQWAVLTASTWNQISAVMTATGAALMVAGIVHATVKGHRHPVAGDRPSRGSPACSIRRRSQ